MTDADELVRRLILRRWHDDAKNLRLRRCPEHLRSCPDSTLEDVEATDGTYGCDTGCEYARFEAIITCPHGESFEYMWGTFGDIAMCIEDIIRDEQRDAR